MMVNTFSSLVSHPLAICNGRKKWIIYPPFFLHNGFLSGFPLICIYHVHIPSIGTRDISVIHAWLQRSSTLSSLYILLYIFSLSHCNLYVLVAYTWRLSWPFKIKGRYILNTFTTSHKCFPDWESLFSPNPIGDVITNNVIPKELLCICARGGLTSVSA